jgi:hypothetical protein
MGIVFITAISENINKVLETWSNGYYFIIPLLHYPFKL